MPPDDFRTELRGFLTYFYENILKKAGAGDIPLPCPPAGADGNDNSVIMVPRAYSDAAAPPPGPAVAEAAAPPPAPAAPPTPPRGRRAGRGGGKPKTS
jgi:hypothetical protein